MNMLWVCQAPDTVSSSSTTDLRDTISSYLDRIQAGTTGLTLLRGVTDRSKEGPELLSVM